MDKCSVKSCSAVGYVRQQSSCWDTFYINQSIRANLSPCAPMKWLLWKRAPQTDAPTEFMHAPPASACASSCQWWECRRTQLAVTLRCLERARVYRPHRVLKDKSVTCRGNAACLFSYIPSVRWCLRRDSGKVSCPLCLPSAALRENAHV